MHSRLGNREYLFDQVPALINIVDGVEDLDGLSAELESYVSLSGPGAASATSTRVLVHVGFPGPAAGLLLAPETELVQSAMHGNPVNPGAEIRSRLETFEPQITAQKRLLHHIIGIGRLSLMR